MFQAAQGLRAAVEALAVRAAVAALVGWAGVLPVGRAGSKATAPLGLGSVAWRVDLLEIIRNHHAYEVAQKGADMTTPCGRGSVKVLITSRSGHFGFFSNRVGMFEEIGGL